MKLWWKLWAGHVYVVITLIAVVTAFTGIALVVLSGDPDVMFYSFVIAVIAFLLAIVFGIMASYRLQMRAARRYIRADAQLGQEAVQRRGKATVPRRTVSYSDAASEAHSAREDDSDVR